METLQAALANAHGLWRYVVLITAGLAIGKSLIGWLERREWQVADERIAVYFIMAVDIGVTLGVLVWLLETRWNGTDVLRSWRHPATMLVAAGAVHVGWIRAKAAPTATGRFARCTLFFAIAGVIILAGVLQIQGVF
ncbi:MAG: hypothetical protein H6642_04160 [Caldilineaceae bacterium]|nr:hypothetical protein [Caldilineaceae bacterium]